MKYTSLVVLAAIVVAIVPAGAERAAALSCLPIDMYLETVVGDDQTIVFTGTSVDKIEGEGYTAEVLTVSDVLQGYVEEKIFVYHQKDETWGYLCNTGPKEEGSTGVYLAIRDNFGKYSVTQRLELTDDAVATLEADLEEAEVEGEVTELSAQDRANQIMTAIKDLLREAAILLKEYAYWKAQN